MIDQTQKPREAAASTVISQFDDLGRFEVVNPALLKAVSAGSDIQLAEDLTQIEKTDSNDFCGNNQLCYNDYCGNDFCVGSNIVCT